MAHGVITEEMRVLRAWVRNGISPGLSIRLSLIARARLAVEADYYCVPVCPRVAVEEYFFRERQPLTHYCVPPLSQLRLIITVCPSAPVSQLRSIFLSPSALVTIIKSALQETMVSVLSGRPDCLITALYAASSLASLAALTNLSPVS